MYACSCCAAGTNFAHGCKPRKVRHRAKYVPCGPGKSDRPTFVVDPTSSKMKTPVNDGGGFLGAATGKVRPLRSRQLSEIAWRRLRMLCIDWPIPGKVRPLKSTSDGPAKVLKLLYFRAEGQLARIRWATGMLVCYRKRLQIFEKAQQVPIYMAAAKCLGEHRIGWGQERWASTENG